MISRLTDILAQIFKVLLKAELISVNLTQTGLLWVERSSKQDCPKVSKKQAETQVVRLQKIIFLPNLLYFELGSTVNNPIYVKLTEIISAFSRTLKI